MSLFKYKQRGPVGLFNKKAFVLLTVLFQLSAIYAQTQFTHRTGDYLDIDGAQIYYEQIANPGKPVMLFLHGGFGNMENFNPILSSFVNDYHLVGIDSRGHGKSTMGAAALTYERMQLDVEAVVKHLQMTDITIVGFSDGGIIGYRLAAANHVPVRKLITIGATWSLEDAELVEELTAGITFEEFRKMLAQDFEFYQNHNPQPDFDRYVEAVIKLWTDKSESGYPCASVSDIDIPTLIIRGNDDDMFPLESAVELTKRIKTACLLNIPFASHMAFREYPQIFEIIVREFLERKIF